jgi:predicted molibdopterin-dependent oxidoreductase YjgC
MIELSVDGRTVEVKEGLSVLDAAWKAGVYVPTLCFQWDLSRFGGCRMCVVEIEGVQGFPASCITPAQQGMVVRTDTERVQEMRKGVLELLLTEHPSSCLVCADRMDCWEAHECTGRAEITTGCKFCPSNGRCEFQKVVEHVTGEQGPIIELPCEYRAIQVDRRDPFIDRDDNLCILCGRCVRACAEQSLDCTLEFTHRGGEARVGTAFGRTLAESGCRFCGACVDSCPTGTLSERVRRWEGRAQERVPTTCSFCSVGCQFDLGVRNDRLIESVPRKEDGRRERDACVRGRFAAVEFVRSVRRLKASLVRRKGELTEVPWETALETAAEGIRRFDPKRSALVYSGSCSNEDIYLAHKFARDVLKTPHVDSSLRLSYGPLLDGAGAGGPVARLADLDQAGAVLVVGADLDFSHPVLAQRVQRAVMAGRSRLVLVGPHATGLSAHASCEIRHAPGEERELLELLQQRLARGVGDATRDDVERAAEILEAAKEEGSAVVLYGAGPMRRRDGAANRKLIAAVAEALSAKLLPLLSRANDRGAMEISASFPREGLATPEIFAAAQSGEMDLLYLIGEDLCPGSCTAKFTVVQDVFLPAEAGKIADVVLPAASFAEVDGTSTSLDGRVRRLRRAIRPTGSSRPDWEILSRLAEKLGVEDFGRGGPSEIMGELAGAVPFYQGITYEALEEKEPLFGHPQPEKRGRPRAAKESGRAVRPATPSADYPFWLVAEFDEYAYKATALSSEVHGLRRLEPAASVVLSRADAEALGVEPGALVRVTSPSGSASAKALLSEDLQQGVARMVARAGEASPAALLELVLDPVSKVPEEICAVRIEKL